MQQALAQAQLCSPAVQKIEGDVRGKPSDGGKDVVNRTLGQEQLDPELRSEQWNQDKKVLGTEVGAADAMRFTGAIPEVCPCSLQLLALQPCPVASHT